MIYKQFREVNLSRLGMGNMRLPVNKEGKIDREKAQAIIDYAYDHGVNYYDTAYMYHGGESESFVGDALKKYPRDSYYLATKFPGMMLKPGQKPADIFEEQLRRCQTDHFDFYLMHNMSENTIQTYMDEKIGLLDYLQQQQKAGRIRYLGFSSHATPETLEKFASWHQFDFAQIQLNYFDWTLQKANEQYEILTRHNLPVIVMEPVRGGRLASLTPEADAILRAAQPDRSIASWAFRWLMRLPNVQLILSGMTEMSQMVDNVATFSKEDPLSDEQTEVLMKACETFSNKFYVPCTACRYCVDECPQGLNIPDLIGTYNEIMLGNTWALNNTKENLKAGESPADCIACGACALKCPQSIDIPGVMAKFADVLAA